MHTVYRVEVDVGNNCKVGPYLAEFHTQDDNIKTMCKYFRARAPWMPEPEHSSFSTGIPYFVIFGCTSPLQLFEWFGFDKMFLRKVLTVFKISVYNAAIVYECDKQVAFDEDSAFVKSLSFEEFYSLL